MSRPQPSHIDLQAVAKQMMREYGFEPEFSPAVRQQVAGLLSTADPPAAGARDLRSLIWSSIDNDTSRDLDQIEVAERMPNGTTKVLIGIADVDSLVTKSSPIDEHADRQTTSVYTGVRNFPMLPEELSNDATSLLEGSDKLAVIIEFTVDANGCTLGGDLYRAVVRNRAQLTYNAVGAWLEDGGPAPPKVAASAELQAQLKLQDQVAQALRTERYRHGALDIETIETRPILLNDQVVDVAKQEKNRATELIEDFMIAANGVVARSLEENKRSSIRRVVKTPARWDRIVELAAQYGGRLPAQPDSKALNDFLTTQRARDNDHFADLSLAVIKLMGPGEYVLERPGDPGEGHFGLAVQDYTHSTAPNRRFPDLVTQRLIKSLLNGNASPYSDSELGQIAGNCTLKENAAKKVERAMQKRIAAAVMSRRIGEVFSAMVTGVTPHGTFVRIINPHVEGLLARGEQGLDVGDRVRVKLISTDVEKGYIDFARA